MWSRRDPRIWSDEQTKVLRENLHRSDAEVARLLSAIGSERTARAIKAKRLDLGLAKDYSSIQYVTSRAAMDGWPILSGSHEQRDRRFQLMAIREAVRLGLVHFPQSRANLLKDEADCIRSAYPRAQITEDCAS